MYNVITFTLIIYIIFVYLIEGRTKLPLSIYKELQNYSFIF